jgi:hypothetical protein
MDMEPLQTITGISQADFLRGIGVDVVDLCEAEMEAQIKSGEMARLDCPVVHRFTPGLYVREISMPTGARLTSKTHGKEHPFVISKGEVSVWCDGAVSHYKAPYTGITTPGSRRVLFVHSDTIWTTFHPTNSRDLDEIEKEIMEPHSNPLLETEYNKADGSLPDSCAALTEKGGE